MKKRVFKKLIVLTFIVTLLQNYFLIATNSAISIASEEFEWFAEENANIDDVTQNQEILENSDKVNNEVEEAFQEEVPESFAPENTIEETNNIVPENNIKQTLPNVEYSNYDIETEISSMYKGYLYANLYTHLQYYLLLSCFYLRNYRDFLYKIGEFYN